MVGGGAFIAYFPILYNPPRWSRCCRLICVKGAEGAGGGGGPGREDVHRGHGGGGVAPGETVATHRIPLPVTWDTGGSAARQG
jgi:hypothetical protein